MPKRAGTSRIPVAFISSTAEDLRAFRAAVRDVALTAEFQPRMMEYFVASSDKEPLEACLRKVDTANVVVVIVAHRYGWIPVDQAAGEYKSITWLECERAVEAGKEILAFLVDETVPWPEEQKEEFSVVQALREGKATPSLLETAGQNLQRLRDFRRWLSTRAIRSTFKDPGDLSAKVVAALYEWRHRNREFAPSGIVPVSRRRSPTRYLKWLRERTAYIDIRGLQVGTGKAHRFGIEELFVSPTTTISSAHPTRRSTATTTETAGADVEDAIGVALDDAVSNTRLVVTGDPGAGKTTFLRRLAFIFCETLLGNQPEGAEKRLGIRVRALPVLVRLSDFALYIAGRSKGHPRPTTADGAAWLTEYLRGQSVEQGWGLDEEFFRKRFEDGQAILLFDGLDEVAGRVARETVASVVEAIATLYKKARIVVTSRPAAYVGNAVLPEFVHARIDSLPHDAVRAFLEHWCELLWPESTSRAVAHRDELLAALRNPEIARLARNPVMLTALAVVHWNERRLPEQRADLYESIIKWLSRSREQRGGRMTSELCVSLLQELALAMHDSRNGRVVEVPKRSAAEMLSSEFSGSSARERIDAAERFLEVG
jgi:hypothetical protein